MSGKNLYLKYRPLQLEDVIGQKQVTGTLRRASDNKNFSHAYLFSGKHGCGKTSSARILANLMTCTDVKEGKVCGKCRACQTIPIGASMDVIEIDGATQRGIDDVRKIIDGSHWSPSELSRKVYIIDECHQLSKEAISALLKITEEPPPYLTFILCTTESRKIIGTILSRCQKFNFRMITSKDISAHLENISKKENIKISNDALFILAKLARGSMRDAIGYLDQIATLANGKEIKTEHVQKYFGATDRLGVLNLIKSMATGNIPLLMDQVNDLIMCAVEIKTILYEVAEMFRCMTLVGIPNINKDILDIPDSEIEELVKIRGLISEGAILKLASIFSKLEKEINVNIHDRWIMEATFINCSHCITRKEVE